MRISDWSSDVCSSDLVRRRLRSALRLEICRDDPRFEDLAPVVDQQGNAAGRIEPEQLVRHLPPVHLIERQVVAEFAGHDADDPGVGRGGRAVENKQRLPSVGGLSPSSQTSSSYRHRSGMIARESCSARVCRSEYISVVAVSVTKTHKNN